jgi:hypothetical protein
LSLDNFLLLDARLSKSRPRFAMILCHSGDNSFHKWTIAINIVSQFDGIFACCD